VRSLTLALTVLHGATNKIFSEPHKGENQLTRVVTIASIPQFHGHGRPKSICDTAAVTACEPSDFGLYISFGVQTDCEE